VGRGEQDLEEGFFAHRASLALLPARVSAVPGAAGLAPASPASPERAKS
jgi:hypothetical protein